jgi:hypothetical protein
VRFSADLAEAPLIDDPDAVAVAAEDALGEIDRFVFPGGWGGRKRVVHFHSTAMAEKAFFQSLGTAGGTFSSAYILAAMGALHGGRLLVQGNNFPLNLPQTPEYFNPPRSMGFSDRNP